MGRAAVVSFINYKGGVGKTTTTYHIGCSLAQHYGLRVLLIDIDPQTNLTFLCAPYDNWSRHKERTGTIATMYKRFADGKAIETKRFIWGSPIKLASGSIRHLDLIPCDIDLLGEDLGGGQISGVFPSMESFRQQAKAVINDRVFLRNALADVINDYNYVLIDCPPNLYLMTQNALVASDWYVITAIPDHLSTIGLSILQKKVDKIADLLKAASTLTGDGHPLAAAQLGGVIFVKVRIGGDVITNTHRDRMERIAREVVGPGLCFKTFTTELIGFSEAAENSIPVWEHTSTNAKRAARKGEYQAITKEFLQRFLT